MCCHGIKAVLKRVTIMYSNYSAAYYILGNQLKASTLLGEKKEKKEKRLVDSVCSEYHSFCWKILIFVLNPYIKGLKLLWLTKTVLSDADLQTCSLRPLSTSLGYSNSVKGV